MKFKLDENLPAAAASVLARVGHDVDTVIAEDLAGAPCGGSSGLLGCGVCPLSRGPAAVAGLWRVLVLGWSGGVELDLDADGVGDSCEVAVAEKRDIRCRIGHQSGWQRNIPHL